MAIVKYCDTNNTPQAVDVTDGSVHVLFTDTSGEALGIDSSMRALYILDYEHHEIHAGSHFFYSDPVELDSAAVQDYMLTTPDTTKWIHLTFSATGSAITQVQIYEAGDRTGTTLQTSRNSNRNSLAAAGMIIHKGQSGGTTDGTLIWNMKSGAAAGASRTPMTSERSNEIILKQNTKYIIRIASGTNDNLTNLQLEWYEHTNK